MGTLSISLFKVSYSELREIVNSILSGVVYSGDENSQDDILNILEKMQGMLDKDSMFLPNRLILEFLLKQREIKTNFKSYRIELTFEKFSSSISGNLLNFVKRNETQCLLFLQEEGYLENFNLEVPSQLNKAVDLVYSLALDHFRNIDNMGLNLSDSIDYITSLRQELLRLLYIRRTQLQGEILTDKVATKHTILTGYQGIESLDRLFNQYIAERFEDNNLSKVKHIYNYADYKLDKTEDKEYRKLFSWGIPNVDAQYAFYSSEITTMVSRPGLGKTNTAIDLVMKARLAGVDVIFVYGESSRQKVRDSMVTWYINYKTGKKFNYKEMYLDDTPEENKILFEVNAKALYDDPNIGKVHFVKYMAVETYKSDILREVESITEHYRRQGINKSPGLLVLDHINDMGSNGEKTTSGYLYSDKDKIDFLYRQTKEMKEYTNLAFLYLSHPSGDANKLLQKGRPPINVMLTGNSSHGDQDSDTVLYLRDTPELEERRLFILGFTKVREGELFKIGETVLEKQFVCSTVLYSEENQSLIETDDYDILAEDNDFYN